MPILLSDAEIARLLNEPKLLPEDYRDRIRVRPKRGHSERELEIVGEDSSEFRLILRQSDINPLDFSIILGYRPPKLNDIFRLRRYNGKSHEHTNTLESQTFYQFHIHIATERYQASGLREDSFAEPTNRFSDFQGAVRAMLADCGFVLPDSPQGELFNEKGT